jgi:hypothetical protein
MSLIQHIPLQQSLPVTRIKENMEKQTKYNENKLKHVPNLNVTEISSTYYKPNRGLKYN